MASPASLVGSGSFAISMRSVSTPAHLPSSPVTRRAACRLIRDRKSTRLNSSHVAISYAVFCLKKKNRLKRYTQNFSIYFHHDAHRLWYAPTTSEQNRQ